MLSFRRVSRKIPNMSRIFNKWVRSLSSADSRTVISSRFASHPYSAGLFILDFPNLVANSLSPADRLQVILGLITNGLLPRRVSWSEPYYCYLLLLGWFPPPSRAGDENVYFISPVECCLSPSSAETFSPAVWGIVVVFETSNWWLFPTEFPILSW